MIFNNYSSPENLLTSRCVCEFGVYHRLQANHLKAMRPSGKTSRLVAFKCVSSLLEHVLKKGNDDENKACFRVVPGMMTKAKVGRCLHKLIYTSTSQSILRYFSLAELVFREICRLVSCMLCMIHNLISTHFSVADIKAQALKAKDASVSKAQSIKARNTRYVCSD